MTKAPWIKWEAAAFLNGIVGMTAEEIGVYTLILNLIYDKGGPIKDDRVRIARRCLMRPTSFEKVFSRLVEDGKLSVKNGLISNARAESVIETRTKVVEKWKKNFQGGGDDKKKNTKDINGGAPPTGGPSAAPSRGVESESVDKKRKKDSLSPRKATVNGVDYSEEFETKVWQPYPRKKGTSKHKAYQLWLMLNETNQQRVIAAIPVHAAQMKLEGRPEEKIKHLQFFISERVYETYAVVSAAESNVVQLPWHKTATREQWAKVLAMYRENHDWRKAWGPEPGKADCGCPADLVAELPDYLRSQSRAPKKPDADAV